MRTDWLFDGGCVADELERLAEALYDARAALERGDADALSAQDLRARRQALHAVTDARRRLRAIDEEMLAEAEALLQESLGQQDHPPVELAAQRA